MQASTLSLIEIIRYVSDLMDALGVAVVSLGVLWGLLGFLRNAANRSIDDSYKAFRDQIIRALLLGLEILVASDIIRTVAISPTLMSVAILGAIITIRCFLSWSLTLEMSGRWPWQTTEK